MFAAIIGTIAAFVTQIIALLGFISNTNSFLKPLSPEKEKELLEKYFKGDPEAKRLLIEHNLRLVAHIAKKFSDSKIEQDDLISIGTIGLIKGVNSFKPDKGTKLATYASRCIENEILMVMRSYKKTANDISFDEPIGQDSEGKQITISNIISDNHSVDDEVSLKMQVLQLYEKMDVLLNEREKLILKLRYGLGGTKPLTQKQVAEMLGLSRSYISRIETKAVKTLRENYDANDIDGIVRSKKQTSPKTRLSIDGSLSELEKRILKLRFDPNGNIAMSRREISTIMGFSGNKAKRIEKVAIGKLKANKLPTPDLV